MSETPVHEGPAIPRKISRDELYSWASDPTALRHLAAIQPPSDWSTTIVRNIHSWGYAWRETKARECLRHIFEDQCGCLRTLDDDGCRNLRRSMLRLNDYDLKWLLPMLGKADYCERSIFLELIRTPAMRTRMVRMGLEKSGRNRP